MSKLSEWKEICTKEEVIDFFTKGDHYLTGLDNGATVLQIMQKIGFKNPNNDEGYEALAKFHTYSCIAQARKFFYRDGFILASKKVKPRTPVVNYLITNLSEERVERHYKIKHRAERSSNLFRNDKLDLLQLMPKTNGKLKELFEKAYASKMDLSKQLTTDIRKKSKALTNGHK